MTKSLMLFDIFVNCNWVDTRWQKYTQTIRRTIQNKQ